MIVHIVEVAEGRRRGQVSRADQAGRRAFGGGRAGCLRFDVLQDAADPRKYYFYEAYKDEAAFEAHRNAPHFKAIDSELPNLFAHAAVHVTKNMFPNCSGFIR